MTGREQAAAKINLYLDVLGVRDDGYHDIRTVFLPLNTPADTIEIDVASGSSHEVVCAAPGVPEGPRNLCWQAAAAYAQETGLTTPWRLRIDKAIPVAAGLGGGSSDAAAVLRALNRLSGGRVSRDRLLDLAAGLGADVPFFLDSVAALGEGTGTCLRPVPCQLHVGVILVCPGFPVSAAWAYQQYRAADRVPAPALDGLLEAMKNADLEALCGHTCNALEPALLRKFPLLGIVCGALLDAGCLCAHVSGSGPSVYGLCAAAESARVAAAMRGFLGTTAAVFQCEPAPGIASGM